MKPTIKEQAQRCIALNNADNQNPIFHVAEVQLTYKAKVKPSERLKTTSSREVVDVLRNFFSEDTIELYEEMKLVLLNRANKVIGLLDLSKGGTTATVADPKLIITTALLTAAHGIILSHNHPSGNLNPSQADIDLTKKVKQAAQFHEIALLDHIIITPESYYSFADEGII